MRSPNTTKPNDGVTARRVTESPNPDDRQLEWILSRANIYQAWEQVSANNGTPVVNGTAFLITVPHFAVCEQPLATLSSSHGSYQFWKN